MCLYEGASFPSVRAPMSALYVPLCTATPCLGATPTVLPHPRGLGSALTLQVVLRPPLATNVMQQSPQTCSTVWFWGG